MKISSVVIPAAGYGTRFLPYSKSVPKEMVPLVDAPALQAIIQEAIDANLASIHCITSSEKGSIKDYFSHNPGLSAYLAQKNKGHLLHLLDELLNATNINYIIQPEARGLGHAVLMAQSAIIDPYFAVMLPDDIIMHHTSALQQLLDCARIHKATILAVTEVPQNAIRSYGIIRPKKQLDTNLFVVDDLVEKPQPHLAPSNLAIIGRYVLSSTIFKALKDLQPKVEQELQLTDGIASLIHTHNEPVLAYKIEGERFDIGNPLGWMKAVIAMGLSNPEYSLQLQAFIRSRILNLETTNVLSEKQL